MHLKTSLTVACLIYLAIGNAHGSLRRKMASKRRNVFHKNKTQETTEKVYESSSTEAGDEDFEKHVPLTDGSFHGVNKINAGDFEGTDNKVKCYLGCVFRMMQALKNNKINLSMVKSQLTRMLEPELARRLMAAFESCKETPGEEGCELAFNFTKCLYEADKEVFMLP